MSDGAWMPIGREAQRRSAARTLLEGGRLALHPKEGSVGCRARQGKTLRRRRNP